MQYKDVVKAMFAKYKGQMPAKDIMKMAAAEYRKLGGASAGAKKGKAKGGSFDPTSLFSSMFGMGMDAENAPAGAGMRRRGRKAKMARGAGVIGDLANPIVNVADSIGSLFGFGLDDAPAAGAMSAGGMRRRGRKAKMPVRGGGVIGDLANPIVNVADSIGSLFGFGLDDVPTAGAMSAGGMRRRGRKAKVPVRGGGVIGDVASPFVDVADSIGSLFGLGLEKKKGKKGKKGGYLSAGALDGGEFPIARGLSAGSMADGEQQQFIPIGTGNMQPLQPQMVSGGNLGSIAKFLPLLALV